MPKLIIPKKESYPRQSDEAKSWINRIYYTKNLLVRFAFLQKFKKILTEINEKTFQNALDVGTGIGIFLPSLTRIATNSIGIDLSTTLSEVKEMCKREGIHTKCFLIRCSACYLPFRDDYFDVITCLNVLEHINNLEIAVKELSRVLSYSGTLILTYPIDNYLVKIGQKALLRADVESFHIHDFSTIRKVVAKYFCIKKDITLPMNLPDFLSHSGLMRLEKTDPLDPKPLTSNSVFTLNHSRGKE